MCLIDLFLALWSQLDLPLECAYTEVANSYSYHRLLHWGMGGYVADIDTLQQDAHMATSCVRRWSRSATMVSGITYNMRH